MKEYRIFTVLTTGYKKVYTHMSHSKDKFSTWLFPSSNHLTLAPSELHIWRANINITKAKADEYYPLLSFEEKKRAERFKFEEHRIKFIGARSMLRTILSHYLSISPKDIVFIENKHGKPMLDKIAGKHQIFFNLSHSHDIALYAISHEEEIGIDIECIDRNIDHHNIATRFFSEKESQHIQSTSYPQKTITFFKTWTAKEAFIKAIGEGLSFPLNAFEVIMRNDDISLESIHGDMNKAKVWSLFQVDVGEEYEASVAIKSKMPNLKCWDVSF